MMRPLICLLATFVVSSSTLASPPLETTDSAVSVVASFVAMPRNGTNLLIRAEPGARVTQQTQCCKICTVGKACGDSCISRDYQCHKPTGCACDG
jgi:hypothetical protein